MRRLLLAVLIGCGARSDLSGVPAVDAGTEMQPESFVLSVSPTSFTMTQGGAPISLAVHVARQAFFNGEVDVDVPSLPFGLSATTAVLAPGVTDVTVMLTASLESKQGTAPPIIVRATTVSARQQTASLNVFIRGCPGCLDTTFGANGRTTVSQLPWSLAIDSSNRIILAMSPPTVDSAPISILVRFDANGNADPSFGVNGEADMPFAFWSSALALDGDDRPLIDGSSADINQSNYPEYGVAIRLTASGLLDSTFGNTGSIVIPTTPTTFGAIVPLPDGSFISAGQTWSDIQKQHGVMWLPKVLPSGALDPTFGNQGVSVDVWQSGSGVTSGGVPIADNQLVVGGDSFAGVNDSHFALARFNGDGSLDTAFGTNGEIVSDVPGSANAIVLTPSGHYFMCGGSNNESQFAMFSPDGTSDASFGMGGIVTTNPIQNPFTNDARNCAVQNDGKLLALGQGEGSVSSAYLLRMKPDGTYDDAFATHGVVTLAFDTYTYFNAGPALQSDGRIVIAGASWSTNSPQQQCFLLRYWN